MEGYEARIVNNAEQQILYIRIPESLEVLYHFGIIAQP